MSEVTRHRRALAGPAALAVAVLIFALLPALLPALGPPPAEAASSCDGVTVRVERPGSTSERCATGAPRNGLHALGDAGFRYTEVPGQAGMVCTIGGYPETCDGTPPSDAYWSYWHADAGASSWTYASRGGGNRTPPPGSHDAWVFGAGAPPSAPPPAPAPASGGSDGSGSGGSAGNGGSGGSGGSGGASGSGGPSGPGGSSGAGGSSGSSGGEGSTGGSAGTSSTGDGGGTGSSDAGGAADRSGSDPASGASGSGGPAVSGDASDDPDDADAAGREDTGGDRDGRVAPGDDARARHEHGLDVPRGVGPDEDGTAEARPAEVEPEPLAGAVEIQAPGGGRSAAGAVTGSVLVAGLAVAGLLRARRRNLGPEA